MRQSKIMQERVRRVRVLFKELGYRIHEPDRTSDMYSAGFQDRDDLQGGFFIDSDSAFLEIAYTFSFSSSMANYVRDRLEEMLRVSYEYGCYFNIQTSVEEIAFSVFTKIYYSGLNYRSLEDTLREFKQCVASVTDLLEIDEGEADERSSQ